MRFVTLAAIGISLTGASLTSAQSTAIALSQIGRTMPGTPVAQTGTRAPDGERVATKQNPDVTEVIGGGLTTAPDDITRFTTAPGIVVSETADGLFPTARGDTYFRAQADVLVWWIKNGPLPVPLATGDRTNGNADPLTSAGLGDPNTVVFIGNQTIDYGTLGGGRFAVEYAVAPMWSIEVGGFYLEPRAKNQAISSGPTGNPVIFRPFITMAQADPGMLPTGGSINAGIFAAFAASELDIHAFAGGVRVASHTNLWGAEINLASRLAANERWRCDALFGFRHLNLRESVDITHLVRFLVDGSGSFLGADIIDAEGTLVSTADSFTTTNHYYGGQVGLRFEGEWGRWSLAGAVKLSLGDTHEQVKRNGSSGLLPTVPVGNLPVGAITTAPGGVLVPPFAIGSATRDQFTVVPELNIQVGFDLTSYLRVLVGYNLLYWSQLARPGDQISILVNDVQNPTSPRFGLNTFPQNLNYPVLPFQQADLWAQGLNCSVELRY